MRPIERRLRDRIKALELELQEMRDDRDKFRSYWARNMKLFIEVHGHGKTVNLGWLIEDMVKFYHTVKSWYW